jgi:GTP cyclohydrolase FolE2
MPEEESKQSGTTVDTSKECAMGLGILVNAENAFQSQQSDRMRRRDEETITRQSTTVLQPNSSSGVNEYDVQQEREDVAVVAGITDLRLIADFSCIEHSLPMTLSITTSTMEHRGVHMSRLVAAAQAALGKEQKIEEYLLGVCKEVDSTQLGATVRCQFELPYMDQFVRVIITASGWGKSARSLLYSFLVGGVTSCPCSRRIAGVGHMQRATLELEIASMLPLSPNFSKIIPRMLECFSAQPKALLKRHDEARAVIKAQENSKFVEDVVRECLERFPDARKIEASALESMHLHNAVARWASMTKKSKGMGSA